MLDWNIALYLRWIYIRVWVWLFWKIAHSAQSLTLSTSLCFILIFFPTCSQILKWVDKNRAFSKFKVNFWGEIATESLWKWFSLKNTKLEEQLSIRSFFISIIFDKLYLVNLCLIFVGSFQNLGDSWERN